MTSALPVPEKQFYYFSWRNPLEVYGKQCCEFVEMAKLTDSQSDEDDAYYDLFFSKSCPVPTYKVILLGDTGAGKTSLFLRYKHGSFRKGSTLYGADRYMKDFSVEDGEKVKVLC